MTAGYGAGAATVLILNSCNSRLKDHEHTDLWIERLDDLIEILERGFIGRDKETWCRFQYIIIPSFICR